MLETLDARSLAALGELPASMGRGACERAEDDDGRVKGYRVALRKMGSVRPAIAGVRRAVSPSRSPPRSRAWGRWRNVAARVVALAVAASVAAVGAPVFAGSAQDGIALTKFEEGKKAFEAGRFEDALLAFQASLALLPSPNTRLYIARCYRAMNRLASAYTAYKLASREAQDRLTATGEKRFKATRDAAASELVEIEAKVPHLTLAIPSDVPDGFALTLDGEVVPKSAWGSSIEVDAGAHVIEAKGPRRRAFERRLVLKEGESQRVEIDAPRIPTGTLRLSLKSKPGGMAARVDQNAVDPAALESAREVDVGAHSVKLEAPGYEAFTWEGSIADHEEKVLTIDLKAAASSGGGTPRWLFFTASGVAVVSLGVASGFAFKAKSLSDQQNAKDPLARYDPATHDRIGSLSTSANVLFVTGGVFAIGAGVLAFTTRWRSTDEPHATAVAPKVTPWVGAGVAGLSLSGSF